MISEFFKNQLLKLHHLNGSGYYVFHKNSFKENISHIKQAFTRQSYPFHLAFSLKANYNPELLKIALENDLFFDCASLMELEYLAFLQVPFYKMWLNTPYLHQELIEYCIHHNILMHADNINQLEEINAIAHLQNKNVNVGIRLHVDQNVQSRFGIETTESEIKKLIDILQVSKNIEAQVLHIHYSTATRSAFEFAARATLLLKAYNKWFSNYNIKTINIGGGIFGPVENELADQFDSKPPKFEDYGLQLEPFIKALKKEKLLFAIEPGMALAANTHYFLSEVVAIKQNENKRFAMINCSKIFIKPTGHNKQIPFEVIHKNISSNSVDIKYQLVGITCMENDVLGEYLGNLQVGDLIVFKNVGAYTSSYRPNFIFASPKILTV